MKVSASTLIGLIIICITLLALFVAAAVGSQWFKLSFPYWFNNWGVPYPTGIKITPDSLIVG